MVSLAWFAHTWNLAERVNVAMGVRRNFSRWSKVDILLIILRLLTLQCKWTFTKRFPVSTPQRKFPMKARTPFASILKYFSSGAVGRLYEFVKGVLSVISYIAEVAHKWRYHRELHTNESEMHLNYQQLRFRLSHLSMLVEQNPLLKSFVRIVFCTSAIRNAFSFHKLPSIRFASTFYK